MVPNCTRAILAAVAVFILASALSCDSPSPLEAELLNTSDVTASWFSISPSQADLGSSDSIASIRMANASSNSVAYTARDNAAWLSLSRTSGTVPGDTSRRIRISTSRAGLAPGTYSAAVAIDAGAAGTAKVRVTMIVESQLQISPLQIDLGSSDTTDVIRLRNESTSSISWTAAESAGWLSLKATSGTVPAGSGRGLRVFAHRAGLASGTYRANVTIQAGSTAYSVPVLMTVDAVAQAQLEATPEQVDFGQSDTTEVVTLINTGGSSVTWTASENSGWLSLNATSGTLAGDSKKGLRLYAKRDGMSPGTYAAKVTISGGDAGTETIAVSMSVPSASSSVALAGQVVDQLGGGGKGGLTVKFDGQAATTDGTGRFSISGTSSSTLRALTVSGSGIYNRGTFARTGDDLWRVLPSSFNMNAFNDLARERLAGTIRWATAPQIYIDARPEGFTSGPEFDLWLTEVKNHAATFFSKWTGHQMSPSSVRVGTSPPADFTPGTIVVHFSEKSTRYGGSSSVVGRAYSYWRSDNSMSSAAIWLRFKASGGASGALFRQAVFAHELGHAMGLSHMDGSTASMMTPVLSLADLTGFDAQAASFLYGRSPGNTAPDNDSAGSYSGALTPARAPVGEEWLCGVAPHLVPGESATAP